MEFTEKHSDHVITVVVNSPQRINSVASPRRFFTFNDVISGRVELVILREINMKDLQVKIAGHSNTQITRRVLDRNGKYKDETSTASHEVLYDVVTLFPPENVKEVSTNKKFTLVKGHYTYSFALKLPMNSFCGDDTSRRSSNLYSSRWESSWRQQRRNDGHRHDITPLPPSFRAAGPSMIQGYSDAASVKYSIKCSLHKADFFSIATRLTKPLVIRPPGPTLSQLSSIPMKTMLSNTILLDYRGSPIGIRMQLSAPVVLIPGYHDFVLTIHTTSEKPPPLRLDSLAMKLVQISQISTDKFTGGIRNEIPLVVSSDVELTQFGSHDDGPFKSKVDVSDLLRNVDLARIVPSFRSCNIDVRYILQSSLFVDKQVVKVSTDVTITGPVLEDEEYTRIYGTHHTPAYANLSTDYPEEAAPPERPARPQAAVNHVLPPQQPPIPQVFENQTTSESGQGEQLPSYEEATARRF
jgi:hypothetical protein